jgi:hypothetical protein
LARAAAVAVALRSPVCVAGLAGCDGVFVALSVAACCVSSEDDVDDVDEVEAVEAVVLVVLLVCVSLLVSLALFVVGSDGGTSCTLDEDDCEAADAAALAAAACC